MSRLPGVDELLAGASASPNPELSVPQRATHYPDDGLTPELMHEILSFVITLGDIDKSSQSRTDSRPTSPGVSGQTGGNLKAPAKLQHRQDEGFLLSEREIRKLGFVGKRQRHCNLRTRLDGEEEGHTQRRHKSTELIYQKDGILSGSAELMRVLGKSNAGLQLTEEERTICRRAKRSVLFHHRTDERFLDAMDEVAFNM
ncbi:Hypothetical protein D9617_12g035310 [Elsinoe fawcettii]|nr:Hypothetical protein D9617_12g035310 [Elsinoe fawcettii]